MSKEKPQILVIEDEETLRDMYRLKFESSGFIFVGAGTGEEGVKMAKTQSFDVILVDLMLENKAEGGLIDGYAVIKELKKNGSAKQAKIYALTNFDQDKNIEQAFKIGADGYLVKSDLTPAELVANVKKILAGERVGVRLKK